MGMFVNLVATRSRDGDHGALARWYSDHVHLLMGFVGLQQATLWRRAAQAWGSEPQYLCLYEFASHADFMAFEVSAARQRAQEVVLHGWAKDGIEIVQRTQYQRLGRRAGAGQHGGAGDDFQWVQLLDLGAGTPQETARWLSDQVHARVAAVGARGAAWHRAWGSDGDGGDALVMLHAPADLDGASVPTWAPLPADPGFGCAPASVGVRWQGLYQRQCQWSR